MLDEQGTITSSRSLTVLGLNEPDMLPRPMGLPISITEFTVMSFHGKDDILMDSLHHPTIEP